MTPARFIPHLARPLVALACLAATAATGQATPDGRFAVTPQQRQMAEQVAQAGVPLSELAANAPDSYTVKPGDTLWGISTLFLTSPWRWPELWGMNKEEVRNPHLIYPGQTLRLVKSDGRARLEIANAGGSAAVAVPGNAAPASLRPRSRELEVEDTAIASIPPHVIQPYLVRPLIVGANELDRYPRIVGTPEGRLYLGRGDIAYARGIEDPKVRTYEVFRPAEPLFDPDDTARRRPIAFEARYVGTVEVIRPGPVTTLSILDSRVEIGVGDRLVPVEPAVPMRFAPRAPEQPVEGRIVSVYGSVGQAAQGNVVALNRGRDAGLQIGHVLALWQAGAVIRDRTSGWNESVVLPDERLGTLFVFRVFDTISYALVVRSRQPVAVGDRFSNPDAATERAVADRVRALTAPPPPATPDPALYKGF